MAGKLNLDKLDLQIIEAMMNNAEISYAELGKKLFVSGGTIHVRIKKLQEFKIVKGTRLNVDLKLLGYGTINSFNSQGWNNNYSKCSNICSCRSKSLIWEI